MAEHVKNVRTSEPHARQVMKMPVKGKTHVCLWGLRAPVLIVPANTGIVYFNQVGGVAVLQMELEGYLIPLPPPNNILCIYDCFNPGIWQRETVRQLPPERSWGKLRPKPPVIAEFITAENLAELSKFKAFCWWEHVCEQIGMWAEANRFEMRVHPRGVDHEAWIWVDYKNPGLGIKKWLRGVLTWQNSD
jgi:hypothetical protein